MVEGHSVRRLVHTLGGRLVGRRMVASSPNGRFVSGASAISGLQLAKFDSIGKNLFAFFRSKGKPTQVVHVHFGMSGRWAVFDKADAPEPKPTTRLVLSDDVYEAHLSAMTVALGGPELFEMKRAKLGEDPLRDDADPERLWERVSKSRKTIGQLLMDQGICFVSKVHPSVKGCELSKQQFDAVWGTSVKLLRRGFETGSILTTDPAEVKALGQPGLRRYVYNRAKCVRCGSRVVSWDVSGRTCYACPTCQALDATAEPSDAKPAKTFNSHCARDSLADRKQTPSKLTVPELRAELAGRALDTRGRKAALVSRLEAALTKGGSGAKIVSAAVAAKEKRDAGESLAVEHVAEHDETRAGRRETTVRTVTRKKRRVAVSVRRSKRRRR